MPDPIRYAQQYRETHLAELMEFLRIPSVSTQPKHQEDVKKAAHWLADAMNKAGLENVKVIKTDGHPLVYADWLHAGKKAPTVLIYGHYDVQPAEPFDLWYTPPFEPTIRDDYLFARGASDDKGQLYIHVKAVESYLRTDGRLPVNVKFIVEGEEESGGANLSAFIPKNKRMLKADVAMISDTAIISPEQPAIVYGLRGIAYMLVDINGPGRDLHSGSFGGGIDNPLNVMGHIIAKLKDEKGRILIPGFYDKVRPLTPEERKLLSDYHMNEKAWLKESGAPRAWGEPEYTLVERLGARPTLDVNGIIGGYTGPGAKTVLPATVHAKISMRLVPDQDPAAIAKSFTKYVKRLAPPSVKISVQTLHTAVASVTDWEIPAMQAAANAYENVFGHKPVYTREGGSIPVVNVFKNHLGLETVMMGFGLASDQIHAPNERFYIPNFFRGVETAVHFLREYA